MSISRDEFEQRIKRFEQTCRAGGLKVTSQRSEIFFELARTDEHPDAETVYRRVHERMPAVSRDTVYRTLALLEGKGLVCKAQVAGAARYDANMDQHHHFVCVECGLTTDFYSTDFDDLALPESLKEIGRAEVTHVEVRGLCLECAGKDAREPPAPKNKEEHAP